MIVARSRMVRFSKQALNYVLLVVLAFIVLFPILWLVSSAFKTPAQQYEWPPRFLPSPIYLGNFASLFKVMPMPIYLMNTLVIAVFSVIGMCISSSLAAFATARMNFHGRNVLFAMLMMTLMIPYAITMIPSFFIFTRLKWIDTFLPLIVPNFFGGAFMIFLLRQAYRSIPQEMMDAAQLDGASYFKIYWLIFIPLTIPIMVTVALLTFLWSWNDLLGPLIYLNDPQLYTVQRGLSQLTGRSGTGIDRRGIIMAGSLLGMLPMLVIYLFGQRYFIQGLTRSGSKG